MKFWTVQKKIIADHVRENGLFTPMLSCSDNLPGNPSFKGLYRYFLEAFNGLNGTRAEGLVFAFAMSRGDRIYGISDYYAFENFIKEKRFCLEPLWNRLATPDSVILEIEHELDFNPLCIDYNDFQALLPPLKPAGPYTSDLFEVMLEKISKGEPFLSPYPSGVIQAHLAEITDRDLVAEYPVFKL